MIWKFQFRDYYLHLSVTSYASKGNLKFTFHAASCYIVPSISSSLLRCYQTIKLIDSIVMLQIVDCTMFSFSLSSMFPCVHTHIDWFVQFLLSLLNYSSLLWLNAGFPKASKSFKRWEDLPKFFMYCFFYKKIKNCKFQKFNSFIRISLSNYVTAHDTGLVLCRSSLPLTLSKLEQSHVFS